MNNNHFINSKFKKCMKNKKKIKARSMNDRL